MFEGWTLARLVDVLLLHYCVCVCKCRRMNVCARARPQRHIKVHMATFAYIVPVFDQRHSGGCSQINQKM